ncbi:unnamed protein product [Calicophoron daubneyi]|uniref:Exonuclease domain-containing protein n=1 Tax=Calicophoron daubneyi TaxID=300641 RepID=A0AAV2THI2_CALDB
MPTFSSSLLPERPVDLQKCTNSSSQLGTPLADTIGTSGTVTNGRILYSLHSVAPVNPTAWLPNVELREVRWCPLGRVSTPLYLIPHNPVPQQQQQQSARISFQDSSSLPVLPDSSSSLNKPSNYSTFSQSHSGTVDLAETIDTGSVQLVPYRPSDAVCPFPAVVCSGSEFRQSSNFCKDCSLIPTLSTDGPPLSLSTNSTVIPGRNGSIRSSVPVQFVTLCSTQTASCSASSTTFAPCGFAPSCPVSNVFLLTSDQKPLSVWSRNPLFSGSSSVFSTAQPYFQCSALPTMSFPSNSVPRSRETDDPTSAGPKTQIVGDQCTSPPEFGPTEAKNPVSTPKNALADSPASLPEITDGISGVQIGQPSSFISSSVSDISLAHLEELLARTTINDVYFGPPHGKDGKLLSLDPSVRVANEYQSLPYSSSSLAFSPPGIVMVTEMWRNFVNDRLSHCNHKIHAMNLEALRNCLYDHGLNQLGSPMILRRRLQEFVRRVRDCQCADGHRINPISDTTDEKSAEPSSSTDKSVDGLQKNTKGLVDDDIDDGLGPTLSPTSSVTSTDRLVKLPKPVILTPDTFYSYLLIIDLEATCDFQERRQTFPEYPHEIIEFPVLLYDTRTRRCVSIFHAYCRPKLKPDLSAFCTGLTHISQTVVDNAHPFPHVLAEIENWLFHKHKLSGVRCAVVCDCGADMGKFMRIQCRLNEIPLPSWATVWINLSKAFRTFYKVSPRHRVTLSTMLRDLSLMFVGQQHRGLDDAINILRVVRTMLADGCLLRVNERVDLGRPPNYVASVPRLISEATSGLMGSRLILLSRKSKASTGISNAGDPDSDRDSLPLDLPEDQRQSLLWLANVQKTRIPRD